MQELSVNEIEQVNGGFVANVVGAVVGAVGSMIGTVIAGGSSTDAEDIITAGIVGGVAGAVNPVSSIRGVAQVIGGGVAGGGTVNMIKDVTGKFAVYHA